MPQKSEMPKAIQQATVGRVVEIRALTGLRWVAAFMVMFYHFEWQLQTDGPVSAFLNHGYLWVDLFFMLSGFVMATVYANEWGDWPNGRQYRIFLIHRIARIYPLYLLVTMLVVILAVSGISHSQPVTIGNLLANISMTQAWGWGSSLNKPAWSISAEWAVYPICPLVFNTLLSRRTLIAVLAGLACYAAIVLVCHFGTGLDAESNRPRGPLDQVDFPVSLLRGFCGFALGVIVWRVSCTPAGRFAGRPWAEATLTIIVLGLLCIPHSDVFLYAAFPVWLLSLATSRGTVARFLASPIAHALGVLSYSIYLLHYRAQYVWLALMQHLGMFPIVAQHVIATSITSLAVVALASVLHRVFEKPARTGLKNLLESRFARLNDWSTPHGVSAPSDESPHKAPKMP